MKWPANIISLKNILFGDKSRLVTSVVENCCYAVVLKIHVFRICLSGLLLIISKDNSGYFEILQLRSLEVWHNLGQTHECMFL